MTFLEAAFEVLRREGKPLHYKELTERVLGKKLLTFVGRTPEVTMQTQLTAAVKKAPGNPFVRVKPGIFGLLRYPELTPEERAAAAKAEEAPAPRVSPPPARAAAGADSGASADGGRRRRRRGGRGHGRDEAASPTVLAPVGAGEEGEGDEPASSGLSAEARAAALAETGVLEGGDDAAGDEEDSRAMDAMEDDETPSPAAGDPGAPAIGGDDDSAGGPDADGLGDDGGPESGPSAGPGSDTGRPASEAGGAPRGPAGGPADDGRRRRRRRRRGGRGEGEGFGDTPRAGEAGPVAAGAEPSGFSGSESGPDSGSGSGPGESSAGSSGAEDGDRQGPRRIMTPVDAAIEILRGQAPGRGMHVRQIADGAARRRLVHGEPNEAWRVMRTALSAEPRERLRAGLRPRVRAAGAGLFALARRPPDAELERAEQVFGEARRALRERTAAALERRIADLPGSAFEALTRVLLQHEGFGPATFVKRVEGTVYVEAKRGRGARPSKCLIGLRFGSSSGGRASIGVLREGILARGQDEGLLMLAGRLAEDAIAEWKKPGPPIEIADGPALAETCVRHGIGVVSAMVSVDFVDADFFAEIAEG
jgi:HB1, ASXL, restriction endonuclease HTH domain/Restriction endonuclease